MTLGNNNVSLKHRFSSLDNVWRVGLKLKTKKDLFDDKNKTKTIIQNLEKIRK